MLYRSHIMPMAPGKHVLKSSVRKVPPGKHALSIDRTDHIDHIDHSPKDLDHEIEIISARHTKRYTGINAYQVYTSIPAGTSIFSTSGGRTSPHKGRGGTTCDIICLSIFTEYCGAPALRAPKNGYQPALKRRNRDNGLG